MALLLPAQQMLKSPNACQFFPYFPESPSIFRVSPMIGWAWWDDLAVAIVRCVSNTILRILSWRRWSTISHWLVQRIAPVACRGTNSLVTLFGRRVSVTLLGQWHLLRSHGQGSRRNSISLLVMLTLIGRIDMPLLFLLTPMLCYHWNTFSK